MFFFFVIVWFNLIFLLCNLGLCLYLQAYVVTISHLDTWITLGLLTINILTLLP